MRLVCELYDLTREFLMITRLNLTSMGWDLEDYLAAVSGAFRRRGARWTSAVPGGAGGAVGGSGLGDEGGSGGGGAVVIRFRPRPRVFGG